VLYALVVTTPMKPAPYPRALVFAAGSTPVYATEAVLDGDFRPHSHDFMELMLIGSGTGTHQTVHGYRSLEEGDVVVLRPGTWHAYLGCVHLEVFNCCFGIELLERELAWTIDDVQLGYLLQAGPLSGGRRGILTAHLALEAYVASRDRLQALHQAAAAQADPAATAELLGHLLLVLAALAREIGAGGQAESPRKGSIHEAVSESMRVLQRDLARAWSLADLAAHVHVNDSYLVRLFTLHTGVSPMAYLAHRRAEHAAMLLLRTSLPVAQIGREVGWAGQSYFARRFRAHYGMSARAYRDRNTAWQRPPDFTHRRSPEP
jgi:AraC family L-rhamnose operon transcriptional activator RhaR